MAPEPRLYDQRGQAPPRRVDGSLVLDTSVDWTITAPGEVLTEIQAALTGVRCRRLHELVLLVTPGNALGEIVLPHLGTVELTTGKWTEREFEALMEDLIRVCASMPWSSGGGAGLRPERLDQGDAPDYQAFLYLRHVLSDAGPEEQQLLPALRAILRRPHRRMVSETRSVPSWAAARMNAAQLVDVLSAPGWTHMRGAEAVMPPAFRGRVPTEVSETVARTTYDTAENRFVLAFLRRCLRVIDRLKEAASQDGDGSVFNRRVRADCGRLSALLDPVARHRLWLDVGDLVHFPASSTVLHGRRGYREVLGHHLRLAASSKLPASPEQSRALLELKDAATLYEIWCYFAVVEAVGEVLGPPTKIDAPTGDVWQERVPWRFASRWESATVWYNRTYSRTAEARATYSVTLRPDIAIELANGDVHLLDAKLKADGERDIQKMHTYRDAIRKARSAWVLYPGERFTGYLVDGEEHRSAAGVRGAVIGVGAVPCTPGGQSELRTLVAAMIRPSVAE